MGRFNTYQSDLKYTPESFEKLSILPMEMRKRHDEVNNTNDLIALNRANTSVSAPFESEAGRLNQDFIDKSSDLAARMSREGASDPGKLEEMRRLKNEYNTQSAANGVLGRGAADKISIDKRKLEYYSYAMKKNQSGEDIKKNWESELKTRNDAASLMLKESPNSTIEAFNPADAPEKIDEIEQSTKLRNIMGSTSTDVFRDGVTQDANGNIVLTEQGLKYSEKNADNAKQLKAYRDYMNDEVLNENSDISKDLKYRANGDLEKYKSLKKSFLARVAHLSGIMDTSSHAESDAYEKPSGGTGPDGDKTPAEIALVKTMETGPAPSFTIGGNDKIWTRKHTLNPINVESIVKSMEIEENKPGSKVLEDRAWVPMKQAAIRMMHIVGDFESKNKDKIEKKMKEKTAEFFNSRYGIGPEKAPKNIAEAGKIAKLLKESLKGTEGDWDQSAKFFLDKFMPHMEELYSEALSESGLDDNLLYTTDGYTIGVGKDADLLDDQINNYVARIGVGNFKKLISSSGGKVIDTAGETTELDEAFSGDVNIKFNSINTMNARGYPSLSFSVTPKKEGSLSKSVTVDFKEEGREAFTEILKSIGTLNLDPVSRKRIETMSNNVASTALIPDIDTDSGKFKGRETYSKQQSDAIQKDYLTRNSTFRNDGFHVAGNKNSLTLNKSGYFTAKTASKGSEDFKPFSIENQVKKEMNKLNLKPGDAGYNSAMANQVAAVYRLMGYDEGNRENSLDKGAFSIELNTTKRKLFAEAATQLNGVIYAGQKPTQVEVDNAMLSFYDKVKGFGLTSKDRVYAQY
jgi:hypothetical protein